MSVITNNDQLVASLGLFQPFHKYNAVAGTAGQPFSQWLSAGLPGAGDAPSSGAGDAPSGATAGAIPLPTLTTGQDLRLGAWSQQCGYIGGLLLCDRCVATSGLSGTSTSVQSVNSTALTRNTTGTGLELYLEVYTALGATAVTTCTVIYVDDTGTSKTTTMAIPASTLNKAGAMIAVPLVSGGTGIRSVTSVQLSGTTGTAGNFGITILRRVSSLGFGSGYGVQKDCFGTGLPLLQSYGATSPCLFLVALNITTATLLQLGDICWSVY